VQNSFSGSIEHRCEQEFPGWQVVARLPFESFANFFAEALLSWGRKPQVHNRGLHPCGIAEPGTFFLTPVIIRGVAYQSRVHRAMWRNRCGKAMQIESHPRE
jgi:hypothetical protein